MAKKTNESESMMQTVDATEPEAPEVIRQRFQLYHVNVGDSIAVIELEDESMLGDPKFINQDRMNFDQIAGGAVFTLIPMEDPAVSVLTRLATAYKNITTKPCSLPSQMIHRTDELVQIVGLLFKSAPAYLVKGPEDITKLISNNFEDEPPEIVHRNVLGSLINDVVNRVKEAEANERNTDDVDHSVSVFAEKQEDSEYETSKPLAQDFFDRMALVSEGSGLEALVGDFEFSSDPDCEISITDFDSEDEESRAPLPESWQIEKVGDREVMTMRFDANRENPIAVYVDPVSDEILTEAMAIFDEA